MQDLIQAQPYIPQVDNYNAVEAFVRRVYNPGGDPNLDAKITLQPYAYVARAFELSSVTPVNLTIENAANADFVLTSPRYRAVIDNADATLVQTDPVAMCRVLLTDAGSQQSLMVEAVDISQYFGQINKAGYDLMYPRIISGRSALSISLQNYSGQILSDPIEYAMVELIFAGVLVRGF